MNTFPYLDCRNAYRLKSRCLCCDGEGFIYLVTCPSCKEVMGMCDEQETLYQNIQQLALNIEDPINCPNDLCPSCNLEKYGHFHHSSLEEIEFKAVPVKIYSK